MPNLLKSKILQAIRAHGQRRMHGASTFYKLALWYIDGYENRDHNMQRNGELALIRALARLKPQTIFDVGSNVGEWAQATLDLTKASVHCFEPVPETFENASPEASGAADFRG